MFPVINKYTMYQIKPNPNIQIQTIRGSLLPITHLLILALILLSSMILGLKSYVNLIIIANKNLVYHATVKTEEIEDRHFFYIVSMEFYRLINLD